MRLTEVELRDHAAARALSTDSERQAAFRELDIKVRNRLNLPANRYYALSASGEVSIDTKRTRVVPVKKISKSDQVANV